MRILVCSPHIPYPPTGGGRADVWRRIEAFTRLGHSVMLVHQFEPHGPRAPLPEHFEALDEVLTARCSYAIKRSKLRTVRQLLNLWRLPWHVAKTAPSGKDRRTLEQSIRGFAPDLTWLEGPWFAELGLKFRKERGTPIVYRSHNVEHAYLRDQARASTSRRNQIAWRVAIVGLKAYELKIMREVDRVLDISLDDLAYWQTEGAAHLRWLPPLPELALADPPDNTISADVVFVGGLRLPNNIHGVRWLVYDVLPILRASRPELVVTIVGSTPPADLKTELEANSAVRTFFDVPSVNPYLFGARVLVNPVSIGSGVQLKMLDMLMTDAPIITRRQGARGLPPECVAQFDVADTKEAFAVAVLERLDEPAVDAATRAEVRRCFTLAAVEDAIVDIAPPEPGRGSRYLFSA